MPQPTTPASVRMEQYCPLCQRLLIPMALPLLKLSSRLIVLGRGVDIFCSWKLRRDDSSAVDRVEIDQTVRRSLRCYRLGTVFPDREVPEGRERAPIWKS